MFRLASKSGALLSKNIRGQKLISELTTNQAHPTQKPFITSNHSTYQRLTHKFKQKKLVTAIKIGVGVTTLGVAIDGIFNYNNRIIINSLTAHDLASTQNDIYPAPNISYKPKHAVSFIGKSFPVLAIIGTLTSFGSLMFSLSPIYTILFCIMEAANKGQGFVKLLERMAEELFRFLTTPLPMSAINDISFSQGGLINLIQQHLPNLKPNSNGVCYGLTHMWYFYQCCNRDLVFELKEIMRALRNNIPLQDTQIDLLKEIIAVQNNQQYYFPTYFKNSGNADLVQKELAYFSHDFLNYKNMNNLGEIIKLAVNDACNQPGAIIRISIYWKSKEQNIAHTIGLKANHYGDKVLIKYFDSNLREATFNSKSTAEDGLLRLFGKAYMPFSPTSIGLKFNYLQEKQFGLFWKKASFIKSKELQQNSTSTLECVNMG